MVRGSNAKKINDSRLLRIQLPGNPCCIGLSGKVEKFHATLYSIFKFFGFKEYGFEKVVVESNNRALGFASAQPFIAKLDGQPPILL